MLVFLYISFFVLALILQITIIPFFSIKGASPDLILILVISIAIQRGKFWGMVAGFIAGLIFDAFGTAFIGLSSLANTVSAFVAGLLLGEHLEQRFGVNIGFIFVSLIFHDLIFYIVQSTGTHIGFWNNLFNIILPQSIYTLVFMVIIHLVLPRGLWSRPKSY